MESVFAHGRVRERTFLKVKVLAIRIPRMSHKATGNAFAMPGTGMITNVGVVRTSEPVSGLSGIGQPKNEKGRSKERPFRSSW